MPHVIGVSIYYYISLIFIYDKQPTIKPIEQSKKGTSDSMDW